MYWSLYSRRRGFEGKFNNGLQVTPSSALKARSTEAPPVKQPSDDNLGRGNGPERRRKNMYVAVERRQQGPKCG